jgi:hypothetical protein
MKRLKFTIVALTIITALVSCGGGAGKQPANAEGFGAIEKEVKSKFGDDAYFTKLNILYIDGIGNAVGAIVTEDPESMKMGEWNLSQGVWKQNSEITLEVPVGNKAADFMFKLDDKISLTKLGELVEKSMKQLTVEKDIKNPKLNLASVKFPKNGDLSETEYHISLKPQNGGTSFSFFYKLNGEFIKMNY